MTGQAPATTRMPITAKLFASRFRDVALVRAEKVDGGLVQVETRLMDRLQTLHVGKNDKWENFPRQSTICGI